MSYNDGISRINSYSLSDFNEFDSCNFRFFVKHHLGKKYEIDEGNEQMALGNLLDQSIKLFHKSKSYGQPKEYLINLVRGAANLMKNQVAQKGPQSFFGTSVPFLDSELIKKATDIFAGFYQGRGGKINQSLGDVGFCEWVIEDESGKFKLWGGPDTFEMGEDGIPEVVDYKSRQNIEKGKEQIDMDLMPKIYMLLSAKKLRELGFNKARFKVRFWQDPEDESFFEDFDLTKVGEFQPIFLDRIERINATSEVRFCERAFCKACQSDKREEYEQQLQKLGLNLSL